MKPCVTKLGTALKVFAAFKKKIPCPFCGKHKSAWRKTCWHCKR